MTNHTPLPKLNLLAEFKDRALEDEYSAAFYQSSRKMLGNLGLLFGVVGILFAIFDTYFQMNVGVVWVDFGLRLLLLGFGVFVFISSRRGGGQKRVTVALIVMEILFVLSYQLLLFVTGTSGFMEQSVAFLLMMMASFLVPHRWSFLMLFALGIMVEFLVVTPLYLKNLPAHQIWGVLLYMLFVWVFGGIFSRDINVTRRKQFFREKQLEILSNTDGLTQIYNRQKFDDTFSEWLSYVGDGNGPFCIVMFDLDDFKALNDRFGHIMGDQFLITCVETVKGNLRANDIFARWGGEEFVLLLPNTGLEAGLTLADRLRERLADTSLGKGVRLTASFGVTCYVAGDTTSSMISRVDACLYRAKASGKNCVCFSDGTAKDTDGPILRKYVPGRTLFYPAG